MSISEPADLKPRKLLVITCSGGAGLIQAANAKEQEALLKDPELEIVRKDTLKDWIWFGWGHWMVRIWNGSQKRGNVAFQSFCVFGQVVVDYLFWPSFFFSALKTLFKEDIDEVIDTQNMGTCAIVSAIRLFNYRRKKQIRVQKVLVDLPTRKATHFFWPIKYLTKKSRSLIRLSTIHPLLEEGETHEQFWHSNCRLKLEDVCYEGLNVRQSFRKYQGKGASNEVLSLKIRYKSKEELYLMKQTYQRGPIRGKAHEREVEFHLLPEDRVFTVLLGSQPGSSATFDYMRNFLELAKQTHSKVPAHLFLFCSDHKDENSLFQKVAEYVVNLKEYPAHFSVVPFSFQPDDVIAPLFYRSNITCTRSGGQTAMELMCVSNGDIWIHSEMRKGKKKKELLKGIPSWEAANAVYLQKTRGAKIVTPDTVMEHAAHQMRQNSKTKTSYSFERPLKSIA